jgi:hypothetical protein
MKNPRLPFGIKETLDRMKVSSTPTMFYDEGKTITQLRKEVQTASELLSISVETEKCIVTYDLKGLTPCSSYGLLVWRVA